MDAQRLMLQKVFLIDKKRLDDKQLSTTMKDFMKNLIKIFSLLFIVFVSIQSFANVNFVFKHNPEFLDNLSSGQTLTMSITAVSSSRAHQAESTGRASNASKEMLPGEYSHAFTRSSIFAPDPTGLYTIRINCYLRSYRFLKSMQNYVQEISVPKDDSTVFVEAVCPVVNQENGQGYALNPIKDVNIKVVEKS